MPSPATQASYSIRSWAISRSPNGLPPGASSLTPDLYSIITGCTASTILSASAIEAVCSWFNVTGKRLYRSASGNVSTKFQLTNTGGDIPISTTTYTDTAPTALLGETMSTTGWIAPPPDMVGLCAGPNGMLAGFSGTTVCFSQPFEPYAWLKHTVPSNDGQSERISISFNLMFRNFTDTMAAPIWDPTAGTEK